MLAPRLSYSIPISGKICCPAILPASAVGGNPEVRIAGATAGRGGDFRQASAAEDGLDSLDGAELSEDIKDVSELLLGVCGGDAEAEAS